MSKQFLSCPRCAGKDINTNTYQVACRTCRWSIKDPDQRYVGHVAALGAENVSYEDPISKAIDALPSGFSQTLMTSRTALPVDHPAHDSSIGTMTAAEFRIFREAVGLSAEWLADQLGVALKTVQRWENGHRPVPNGVVMDLDIIPTAMGEGMARPCAEHLLRNPDAVMMIPRTESHLGFPPSWYRALVESVRHLLVNEYGDEGLRASSFSVVYSSEVEAPQ